MSRNQKRMFRRANRREDTELLLQEANDEKGLSLNTNFVFDEEHKISGDDYHTKNDAFIYAVPTVESFGDESTLVPRQYATPRLHDATNQNQRQATNRVATQLPNKQKRFKNSNNYNVDKEFQVEEDFMAVAVRAVPIAERSAFDLRPLPESLPTTTKKVSPSLQHLQLLQLLQSQTHVRQLAFSPSVGLAADILSTETTTTTMNNNNNESPSSTRKKQKRDGRYRSIDPVQATLAALPSNPPLLSNKKHRMVVRADVGFPNASMEEIQQKQAEIQQETEWEEASPRLIVLVTSDDLGTAVQEDRHGMPFCGTEMLMAKQRNQEQFARGTTSTMSAIHHDHWRWNMLAPPLDSSFSNTVGWRSRPFHDRPPGMNFAVVSPLMLEFDVGPLEPLVCSLTLYTINSKEAAKASEDFWFPAGDGKGRMPSNRHKAIFSYDPLVVDKNDLHIVLQVYKATHPEFAAAYLAGKRPSPTAGAADSGVPDWTGMRKRSNSKNSVSNPSDDVDWHRTRDRSTAIWKQYGSQFLSPLSFGVTRLGAEKAWPKGDVQQNLQLYCFPPISESQEDFCQRLKSIVAKKRSFSLRDSNSDIFAESSSSLHETSSTSYEASVASTVESAVESPFPGTKIGFWFTSPKKRTPKERTPKKEKSPNPKSSSGSKETNVIDTPILKASVALFTSALSVDFLQTMLQTPTELAGEPLPRVLVDVSGESAIMMDPKSVNTGKRSNLLRLPSKPGGYLSSSDFREVLFLPKNMDVHPSSNRSPLNLLYLYPRLIKHSSKSSRNKRERYTVRIRMIQQSVSETNTSAIESNITPQENFYNPAPWAGRSYLRSVYTRVPGDIPTDKEHDLKAGIPLRDEFKLKLPMVLDGTYYLNFTLYLVDFRDETDDGLNTKSSNSVEGCGLSLQFLAETTIPLSSSSMRDPKSGVKATTIIPNGLHRLKLGDFKFQLETRLASAIHVSDPAVASALRNFPYRHNEALFTGEPLKDLTLVTKRVGMSRQRSDDSALLEKIPYSTLFSAASGSALATHFQPLLLMHLSNLITSDNNLGVETSTSFLVENVKSLLEICKQIRCYFLSIGPDGEKRYEAFVKDTIDSFDERFLHSSNFKVDMDDDGASDFLQVEPSVSEEEEEQQQQEDDFDGGAIRRRKKNSLRSGIDHRISRTFSAMESSDIQPFSRRAYGATKTDRMRVEAELDVDNGRMTHLVDDDETVVTVATAYTAEARLSEAREVLEKGLMLSPKKTIKETIGGGGGPFDFINPRTLSELDLAKRVRSAAEVMLAPCVAQNMTQNLAEIFSSQKSPRSRANETIEMAPSSDNSIADHENKEQQRTVGQILTKPGSDLDRDEHQGTKKPKGPLSDAGSIHRTTEGTFRSPWDCPMLKFSTVEGKRNSQHHTSIRRGAYVYESIWVLWIRAWTIQAKKSKKSGSNSANIPEINLGGGSNIDPLSMFHAHLDMLLPLCLKSIILRYGQTVEAPHAKGARVIVDDDHMNVMESFVKMLALTLVGHSMTGLKNNQKDGALETALSTSDYVLDFLTGLCTVLHPAQIAALIRIFFTTLRNCETEQIDIDKKDFVLEWTEENMHRVKCSRQLRLRAVEKFAVLPNFVALNYPLRFSSRKATNRQQKATWKMQYSDTNDDDLWTTDDSTHDSDDLIPQRGWLAELLTAECLSICSLSCEAVVAEAMAHKDTQETTKTALSTSLKNHPTAPLKRGDLLMFQSIAIHAITCVHELLLRRHAMDKRFQKESSRETIASLFLKPIFDKSLASVRWLARMESTHRVRSLWLLCFVYILQEAPENQLREAVSSYNNSKDIRIHRFIRLLRLGSSTFQSFIDQERYCMFPSEIDKGISPWLLQESFNTICATTIIVVEECACPTSTSPAEQRKMIHGILDLLLHVLTTPQSSVTHLRAVGGTIQAFEKFGINLFLEVTGGSLQHWIRIILSLMNSLALSVRSIAVDFVVSLLGSAFDSVGNIDELALIFVTVLPEVVAREIALCSVSGHVKDIEDIERSVWPLRRSFADVEDANPLDDDRVDPQLSPVLSVFCRACQAVIDGVLVEMRLKGSDCIVVGARMKAVSFQTYTFDADEESLFEAANFFVPEIAPLQRIRWLMTLKSLHKAKGQWVEAAETLMMCARTISDSIPHLKDVWRPSRFSLWSDTRRSLWLSTVGEDMGNPERGNEQVMSFADAFLEPELLESPNETSSATSKLPQPTVSGLCLLLTKITKEAVELYLREEAVDGLAYTRLESLLKLLMDVLDEHGMTGVDTGRTRLGGIKGRRRYVEEEASLRKVIATISTSMTKLAERLLGTVQDEPNSPKPIEGRNRNKGKRRPYFVQVLLSGKKPRRFLESTTLPTFCEWDTPCICRVPKKIVDAAFKLAGKNHGLLEEIMCTEFGKPLRTALSSDGTPIKFRAGKKAGQSSSQADNATILMDIAFVQMKLSSFDTNLDDAALTHQSKHFLYQKSNDATDPNKLNQPINLPINLVSPAFVEMTVANSFPCPLSRQRTLLTTEIVPK